MGAGRNAGAATEDDDADTAHLMDQDDEDVHVKLLNPVKVMATVCSIACYQADLSCAGVNVTDHL